MFKHTFYVEYIVAFCTFFSITTFTLSMYPIISIYTLTPSVSSTIIDLKKLYFYNRSNFASYGLVLMSLIKVRALRRVVFGSILGLFFELSNVPLFFICALAIGGCSPNSEFVETMIASVKV